MEGSRKASRIGVQNYQTESDDPIGAFCPHGKFRIAGASTGTLANATFGAKDLIDIAGHVTGAGNPRWLETHSAATVTASCVTKLLEAGATMVGKTLTDELAYSLNGDNAHYGTPINARAPERVTGGSSSGSAAAVAAGLCDFALGTDTGGSVRIPASYCGLYGIRTTHGLIPMDGVVPLQPSFDTLGWFARDASMFSRVGRALFMSKPDHSYNLRRLLSSDEATWQVGEDVRRALKPSIDQLSNLFIGIKQISIAPAGLEVWRKQFMLVSAAEAWATHGNWIMAAKPDFSPAIASRFEFARQAVADRGLREMRTKCAEIRDSLRSLLRDDGVLCIPSAPGPAPLRRAAGEAVENYRQRAQRLTCIATIAGLPQVSIPVGLIDGAPIGLSLIGPPGSDAALLALCTFLESKRRHSAHA